LQVAAAVVVAMGLLMERMTQRQIFIMKTVTVMPILVQADIQTHNVKLTLAHTAINGQFWKIAAKVVSQVVEIKIRLLVHNFHIHSIFFSITFYLFENPN
jgi:hypothetical protein